MAGINVLSDTPKGGQVLEKGATQKGKDVSDSNGNATSLFAAVLSGSMTPYVGSKGQNSKASQVSEEKEDISTSVQSELNPNDMGSLPGYCDFGYSFLPQPMLQSDLPAGKEANSGNIESQVTGGISTADFGLTNSQLMSVVGNNQSLEIFNNLSLVSDESLVLTGMTGQNSQGNNPEISELDQYRQVISKLLVALSGEITDPSQKGAFLGSESTTGLGLRQEMTKIIQGWLTQTDDEPNKTQLLSDQLNNNLVIVSNDESLAEGKNVDTMGLRQQMTKILESWLTQTEDVAHAKQEINVKNNGIQAQMSVNGIVSDEVTLSTLDNISTEELRQVLAKIVKAWTNFSDEVTTNDPSKTGKDNLTLSSEVETLNSVLTKENHNTDLSQKLSADSFTKEKIVNTLSKTKVDLTTIQVNNQNLDQDSLKNDGVSGIKDIQDQNVVVGTGLLNAVSSVEVANTKSVPIPVWQQLSTVLREYGLDGKTGLKELDIQLHPADMGKVHLLLQWENGKVNLQVQASENATSRLIQSQLPELRQTLMNQGVNCGSMQMGQGGDQQHNSRGDEPQRSFEQRKPSTMEEDKDFVTVPLSHRMDGLSRINVTA